MDVSAQGECKNVEGFSGDSVAVADIVVTIVVRHMATSNVYIYRNIPMHVTIIVTKHLCSVLKNTGKQLPL